jgi:hypothetical protein
LQERRRVIVIRDAQVILDDGARSEPARLDLPGIVFVVTGRTREHQRHHLPAGIGGPPE